MSDPFPLRPIPPRRPPCAEPDTFERAVVKFGIEQAKKSQRRACRWMWVSLLLLAGCFLAGVWVDWRWLPTALLALVGSSFFAWLAGGLAKVLDEEGIDGY
jgi:hypothetical protein